MLERAYTLTIFAFLTVAAYPCLGNGFRLGGSDEG